MAGLVPAIHVLIGRRKQECGSPGLAAPKGLRPRRRDKPGGDAVVSAGHIMTSSPRRRGPITPCFGWDYGCAKPERSAFPSATSAAASGSPPARGRRRRGLDYKREAWTTEERWGDDDLGEGGTAVLCHAGRGRARRASRFSISNRRTIRCCGAKCRYAIPVDHRRELLITVRRAIVEKPCKMGVACIVAIQTHGG